MLDGCLAVRHRGEVLLPDGPLPIPPLDCEEVLYKGPVLHEKRFKCTELSICNVDTLTASLMLG